MSSEIKPAVYRDLAHRAQGAAVTLESYYGGPNSQIVVGETVEPQPMTDQEAEQKLYDLADDLIIGKVRSHIGVARVIRNLGTKMSPSGGASLGINNAALKVEEVILQNGSRLMDSPKPSWL